MRNYESRFRLPSGKWAYIQIPNLAEAAKQQIKHIKDLWDPPPYFYHLLRGGHVAGLKIHQDNTWFGKIDLSAFFSRVSRYRVTRSLKGIGYSYTDADDFAVASTVCVNHARKKFALPYGFVQSPILASVCLDNSALGNCFRKVRQEGIALTVYVDDIIISSNSEQFTRDRLAEIRQAAATSNFPINEAKSLGPTNSLSAFNIGIDDGVMAITVDRFEEMCQDVLHYGPSSASDGILGYVRSVNETQAVQMIEEFPRVFSSKLN